MISPTSDKCCYLIEKSCTARNMLQFNAKKWQTASLECIKMFLSYTDSYTERWLLYTNIFSRWSVSYLTNEIPKSANYNHMAISIFYIALINEGNSFDHTVHIIIVGKPCILLGIMVNFLLYSLNEVPGLYLSSVKISAWYLEAFQRYSHFTVQYISN